VEEVVPVVVVIIVLVAWAVILGPGLIKRRARRGDQSISHFHYQLRVLEHSAPEPIVAPAYRLRSVDGSGEPTGITYADTGKPPVLTVVGAKELPRPALAFLGEPVPDEGMTVPGSRGEAADTWETTADTRPTRAEPIDRPNAAIDDWRDPREQWVPDVAPLSDDADAPGPWVAGRRGMDSLTREEARRRRRDTLSVLAVVFVTTLLFGAVTGATVVWALCALDSVALVAYVSVLVHLRRMAMERERKLRYLEPRRDVGPARVGGPATPVSGRYAHPSNQQAIAR
jgi:hypothetical protein